MPHQWGVIRTLVKMLPRASSVRRGLCLLLLLAAACFLVLLQALQLPVNNGLVDRLPNLTRSGGSKLTDGEQPDDYSWMVRISGPVPTICQGPDSKCLEALLLSPREHLASENGLHYRTPAIVHLLAIDPANQHLTSVGAFLLDWHRLHRNWTYVLWTRDEIQRLVRVFFRRYLPLVEGSPQILRHLAPLLIAQKYGGVVANANHRPTRSVDPLRRLPAVFSVQGRWPHFSTDPGLFLAAPSHPFLQYCSDQTLHRPTDHGGLTRLLLDYAAAFPVTERPENSLHLAQLAPSTNPREENSGVSGDRAAGNASGGGGQDRLPVLLRKCDELASKELDRPRAVTNWPLQIGCAELRELRRFLETGGGAFVRGAAPSEAERQPMTHEQLASVYPILNVGLQMAWKVAK